MVDERDDAGGTERDDRTCLLDDEAGSGGNERVGRDGPLGREDQEIGAAVASESEFLLDVLPHFYRGEVSQANSAQDRIDRTTDWASRCSPPCSRSSSRAGTCPRSCS